MPSVKSSHTGVTCGEPSFITVARCAKDFLAGDKRSRYCSGIAAMASSFGWGDVKSTLDYRRQHSIETILTISVARPGILPAALPGLGEDGCRRQPPSGIL